MAWSLATEEGTRAKVFKAGLKAKRAVRLRASQIQRGQGSHNSKSYGNRSRILNFFVAGGFPIKVHGSNRAEYYFRSFGDDGHVRRKNKYCRQYDG